MTGEGAGPTRYSAYRKGRLLGVTPTIRAIRAIRGSRLYFAAAKRLATSAQFTTLQNALM